MAPVTLINNLEKSAQKFDVRKVPENKFPKTLNPPKKTNKPIRTFKCINSFCLAGFQRDSRPKIKIGAPNIAGIYDVSDLLSLLDETKIAKTIKTAPYRTEILSGFNPKT